MATLLGGGAIDLALRREDRIDPAHRVDAEWPLVQISKIKEFATAVAPASGLTSVIGAGRRSASRDRQTRIRIGRRAEAAAQWSRATAAA
jgi:hypothetical protein